MNQPAGGAFFRRDTHRHGGEIGSADTITDHDEIRSWAEERGGRPSRVNGTGGKSDDAGILRIDFGETDDGLEEISWDEVFEVFEDRKLALLRQDET